MVLDRRQRNLQTAGKKKKNRLAELEEREAGGGEVGRGVDEVRQQRRGR